MARLGAGGSSCFAVESKSRDSMGFEALGRCFWGCLRLDKKSGRGSELIYRLLEELFCGPLLIAVYDSCMGHYKHHFWAKCDMLREMTVLEYRGNAESSRNFAGSSIASRKKDDILRRGGRTT